MSGDPQDGINSLHHPEIVQARVIELAAHMYQHWGDWLAVRVSEQVVQEGKVLFEAGDATIARRFSRCDDVLDADKRSAWLAYSVRASLVVKLDAKQLASYE